MVEIKLAPMAYLDIYRHCTAKANNESLIYGILTGYVDDNVPYIKKYIPYSHYESELDFETKHEFFLQADRFNEENYDPEFISDEILGWVRSYPTDDIEPSEIDRKNHVYFQTAYSKNAIAMFMPPNADQYVMQVKNFKDSLPEIDITSPFEDIDWNFDEIDDLDDLFRFVLNLQINRKTNQPLIDELIQPETEEENKN
jgi:proteasome lid subunit RPN8/RPN11